MKDPIKNEMAVAVTNFQLDPLLPVQNFFLQLYIVNPNDMATNKNNIIVQKMVNPVMAAG